MRPINEAHAGAVEARTRAGTGDARGPSRQISAPQNAPIRPAHALFRVGRYQNTGRGFERIQRPSPNKLLKNNGRTGSRHNGGHKQPLLLI
jgi:hypothetical protein